VAPLQTAVPEREQRSIGIQPIYFIIKIEMKRRNSIFHLNKSTLRSKVAGIGASMFALSDKKLLLSTIMKEAWRLAILSLQKVRVSSRVKITNNFMQHVFRLYQNHGATFTIQWLKGNSVALQRFIAGSPYRSLREANPDLPLPRLINGLPSIISKGDRILIREGHTGLIRYWLTLFNVFRILEGPLKPKMNTITDPYSGTVDIIRQFKWFNFTYMWKLFPGFTPSKVKTSASYIVNSQASGPNNYNASYSYFTDLCWWAQSEEDYLIFKEFCKVSKSFTLWGKFDRSITLLGNLLDNGARIPVKGSFATSSKVDETGTCKLPTGGVQGFVNPQALQTPLRGGQFAFKEEAAGKLRIFAIVDIWTQSVLQPLHSSLFKLLRSLPNDGTFDQESSFRRAQEKATASGKAFSVDLSSATDRLPISIQADILDIFTGVEGFGSAWQKLLVSREYFIPETDKVSSYGLPKGKGLTYATGQPMGALSSWAMLALTHHMIVQFSVNRVRGTQTTWYMNYEVLGDDIVIFDHDIYLEYLKVMSELGVPCNPSKSIPALNRPVCEFAKRTSLGLVDVSGLSWKEFLQGNNLPGKINMALRLGSRQLISTESLLKAVLSRFGKDMNKPVQTGMLHGLIGLLGSLISKDTSRSLASAIVLLVDPDHLDGEEYKPDEVSAPRNQAMRYVVKMLNGGSEADAKTIISRYEERLEFAKDEILPFAAQTAYLTALGLVKETVRAYDDKVTTLAHVLVDCSRVKDRILKAQIRSVAEDILLKDEDPQDFLDDLQDRIAKATRYGEPSLEWSLALLKEATEFSMRFDIQFGKEEGIIPTENAFALTASRAGARVRNYWFAPTEFKGYPELGQHTRDWLRAA